ncbi:MAG TPA: tetratricopeptide repeat protein, partial [Sandaracinaceae bacterium]
MSAARRAVEYLPHDSYAHSILGRLLAFSGHREEARAALRRAIELDVDNSAAMQSLLETDGPAELREDVRFVLDLLGERVSQGPGLTEAAYLSRCLPHDERIERLRRLVERVPRRPDGWEAVVRACIDAGDLDEARRLVTEASARFPYWVSLHLLAADVARLANDDAELEAALRRAAERAPLWPDPVACLARVLRERGELERAGELVDGALARMPRAIALRSERATILWARGDRELAFEAMLEAVRDAFYHDDAFRRLTVWATELGRRADVEALVRAEMAKSESASLPPYRLALLLSEPERLDERVEAAREALRRNPRHAEAADLLAEVLARAGRYEEALEACPPPEWRGVVPTTIRGRRTWVLAEAGRMDEAIAAMGTILAAEPSYGWGRRNLCDWLDRRGDTQGFLHHAQKLVEHEPQLGLNHVYLGDALLATGAHEEARAAFARATELSPENSYAVTRFVELDLERGGDPIAALERAKHVLSP